MLPEKKSEMTSGDKKFLEKSVYEIIPSRYYKNSFKNKFQGFGWTHNFGKEGLGLKV